MYCLFLRTPEKAVCYFLDFLSIISLILNTLLPETFIRLRFFMSRLSARIFLGFMP